MRLSLSHVNGRVHLSRGLGPHFLSAGMQLFSPLTQPADYSETKIYIKLLTRPYKGYGIIYNTMAN
jgi:hypothetical protein